jgi:hypothetical protein
VLAEALVAPLASVTGSPKLAPSTMNWTVPVAVPTGARTVAVKVRALPLSEGLAGDAETEVMVSGSIPTTWYSVPSQSFE